jgi:hypothetical protein
MVRILKSGVNGNEWDLFAERLGSDGFGRFATPGEISAGMTGTSLRRQEATNERQWKLAAVAVTPASTFKNVKFPNAKALGNWMACTTQHF